MIYTDNFFSWKTTIDGWYCMFLSTNCTVLLTCLPCTIMLTTAVIRSTAQCVAVVWLLSVVCADISNNHCTVCTVYYINMYKQSLFHAATRVLIFLHRHTQLCRFCRQIKDIRDSGQTTRLPACISYRPTGCWLESIPGLINQHVNNNNNNSALQLHPFHYKSCILIIELIIELSAWHGLWDNGRHTLQLPLICCEPSGKSNTFPALTIAFLTSMFDPSATTSFVVSAVNNFICCLCIAEDIHCPEGQSHDSPSGLYMYIGFSRSDFSDVVYFSSVIYWFSVLLLMWLIVSFWARVSMFLLYTILLPPVYFCI